MVSLEITLPRPSAVPLVRWSALALLVLLTAVLLAAMPSLGEGTGDGDAGDDMAGATTIGNGTWTGGIFRNATEEDVADYYVLAFDPGVVVQVDASLEGTSSTHLDVHFRVFDRDEHETADLEFPRVDMAVPFHVLTNTEVDEPVYYLSITWDGSSIIEFDVGYTLSINISGPAQDDLGSGGDAPRSWDGAYLLTEGEYTGTVGGIDPDWFEDSNADRADMYLVKPEAGMFLKVELTLTRTSTLRERPLALSLENGTGEVFEFVTVSEVGKRVTVRHFPTSTEDLYLNLSSTAVALNYSLVVYYAVPGADGEGRADAGEDADHAMDMDTAAMQGTIMRGFGAQDLVDYYELEVQPSQFVETSLTLRSGTASASNVRFHILDYTKSEVINFTFSGLDQPVRFAALTNSEEMFLRYYLGVSWVGAKDKEFEFRYDLTAKIGPGQDDLGLGKDVTNATSKAPEITLDTPFSGSVGGSSPQWERDMNVDGSDAYQVVPTSGRFVVITGTLDGFHGQRRVGFDVQVEDQSGALLLKPQSAFDVGDVLEMRLYVDSGLPVYVRVISESEMCNYTLTVSLEEPPDVDLFVGNLSVTPARPGPGTEATITVIVASSALINPATLVRVEVYAGGDLLDHSDVIFDNSDQETVTFPWTVPSSETDIRAVVDTLNAVPWEPKDNNDATLKVKVGGGDDGGDDDDSGRGLFFWVMVLVIIIVVVIVVTVAFVFIRGHGAEDEGPEDY